MQAITGILEITLLGLFLSRLFGRTYVHANPNVQAYSSIYFAVWPAIFVNMELTSIQETTLPSTFRVSYEYPLPLALTTGIREAWVEAFPRLYAHQKAQGNSFSGPCCWNQTKHKTQSKTAILYVWILLACLETVAAFSLRGLFSSFSSILHPLFRVLFGTTAGSQWVEYFMAAWTFKHW